MVFDEEHRLELFAVLVRDARSTARAALNAGSHLDFALSCSTRILFRRRQSIVLTGWLLWDRSRFDADAGLMGIQRDDRLVLARNGDLYRFTGRTLYNQDCASALATLQAGRIVPHRRYDLDVLEALTAALADFVVAKR